MSIPKTHPRYQSLQARHVLTEAYEKGILATAGLIAHGRGEAFDYIIGEKTIPPAEKAEMAAASILLIAEKPVISVNGNTAVLCPKETVELADFLGARIEINLFYRTKERMQNVLEVLEDAGAKDVLGMKPDARIDGLDHQRGNCTKEGIYSADVVFVPLEDGDRCQALINAGKKVCVVDLNPLSRTSLSATVSIMDEVTRSMKNIVKHAKNLRWPVAEKIAREYNNDLILSEYLRHINKRLSYLADEKAGKR